MLSSASRADAAFTCETASTTSSANSPSDNGQSTLTFSGTDDDGRGAGRAEKGLALGRGPPSILTSSKALGTAWVAVVATKYTATAAATAITDDIVPSSFMRARIAPPRNSQRPLLWHMQPPHVSAAPTYDPLQRPSSRRRPNHGAGVLDSASTASAANDSLRGIPDSPIEGTTSLGSSGKQIAEYAHASRTTARTEDEFAITCGG